MRRMALLHVRCSASDLGISSHVRSPFFARPSLFLFDRVQGGVGLAHLLLDAFPDLVRSAAGVVNRCECREGCPACTPVRGPRWGPRQAGEAVARALAQRRPSARSMCSIAVGNEDPDSDAGMIAADFGPEGHLARGACSEEGTP
ncbi:MAG: DUF1998 domain-containing protein [Planctomycetota bacterium]